MKIERVHGCLGSAGCQPAMLGGLPGIILTGKLPALSEPKK